MTGAAAPADPSAPAGSPTAARGTSSAAAAPAIVVDGLRKAYAGREILGGITFDVRRGELFALLGPNGAGKTTTVEIIEGYRVPDGGSTRVLGLDPARDGRRLRPRIGLMLQDGGIDNRTTAREVLHLYARFYRDPEDPDRLLEAVDLGQAAGTRYRRLSGGEKQRLALALALLGRPELLVLDEPTAGMDPAAKQATRERIADLRAAGTTILLTTHELGDVERLADRVAVLDHGRLVALGHAGRAHGRRRAAPAPAPVAPARGRRGVRPRRGRRGRHRRAAGRRGERWRDGRGLRRRGPWTGAGPATRRGGGGLVRVPGPPRGGAADRGGEPRGAIPRAGPRRPGLGRNDEGER